MMLTQWCPNFSCRYLPTLTRNEICPCPCPPSLLHSWLNREAWGSSWGLGAELGVGTEPGAEWSWGRSRGYSGVAAGARAGLGTELQLGPEMGRGQSGAAWCLPTLCGGWPCHAPPNIPLHPIKVVHPTVWEPLC